MKNIVPNENCLTEVQLLRYLHDECPSDEEKAIDRHLTHCPMCSDALEGAMLLNTGRLERSLKHLDTKIGAHFSDKTPIAVVDTPVMTVVKKPKSRGWLWAAASIVALATAGVWLLTKPYDNQLAESTIASTDSLNSTIQDSSPIGAVSKTDVAQSDLLKKQSEKNANTGVPSSNPSAISDKDGAIDGGFANNNNPAKAPDNTATTSAPQTDIAVNQDKYATQKPIATENTPTENEDATKESFTSKASKRKAEETNLKDANIANAKRKTDNYEKQSRQGDVTAAPSSVNNYPGAAAQNSAPEYKTSTTRAKIPADNGLTDYQLGMQFYKKGAFNDAVASLNRVLAKQSSGQLYQDALWYLANSYLKLGKKQDAQGLLQRIVSEKGKYAQQAADLLNK